MHRDVTRAIVGGGACVGLGLALQPALAAPEVRYIAERCAETLLLSGGSGLLVLGIGYVHHRLQLWRAERPLLAMPAQVYAVAQSAGPVLAGQAALSQSEERRSDPDDVERQCYLAVVRFCVIGENLGSFAYRAMHASLDRPTWDRLTEYLAREHVLRIGSGTRPTLLADGWTSARVRVELKHGRLPLPQPVTDVPHVVWDDYRHAVHTSKHTSTQARWKGDA